jgi:hypothetical protein
MIKKLLAVILLVMSLTSCHSPGRDKQSEANDRPVSSVAQGRPPSQKDPTFGVRGRVTSSDGTAIPGQMISAESLDKPKRPIPELAVVTGQDGSYWWPLREGRYRLSIVTEESQTVSRDIDIRANAVQQLDFTVPRKRRE